MGAETKAGGKSEDTSPAEGLSEQERAAVRERASELRTKARRGRGAEKAAADERDVLTKIANMPEPDRALAERVHAIVTTAAPELSPKLWYGQPAYARKGKVVCFFRSGQADGEPYSTFGFTPRADLDNGSGLWPTSYALTEMSEEAEETLTALVEQAVR
ncbi:hypothetical protein CUT44_26735 [Streptomyces carminius]|uniref:YdhG-like domain-containing protein n=1 Tax=Streptomyces carminius TaxID=2665496 RepID=A0A2M8LS13_9ACTN|nr:DUF1801 domain-containing protein [Streptomyces carminius]PJE94756.1 hypothetical protein CUT44_26735 [Streptomyces carminius]